MSARGALRGLLSVLLSAAAASAVAASFGLSPLALSIGAKELSGAVVVTNTGKEELVVQARAYAWTQAGKEARADTRDLLLNPPIFKLAAGEQQLVRVASRTPPAADSERAYRVVFSEVVTEPSKAPGFRITVAMDIPVYIEPLAAAAPAMAWRLQGNALVAENTGGRHYRLREVQLVDSTAVMHTIPRLVVLARSRLEVELPQAALRARQLRLIGQDDADQPVAIDVAVPAAR
jgi:fimbrial chaperone protein